MTRQRLYHHDPKIVRDLLNEATKTADVIHEAEHGLILLLDEIDRDRFYVRYGYKSLKGFCHQHLRFTRTQSQRIATLVRRR